MGIGIPIVSQALGIVTGGIQAIAGASAAKKANLNLDKLFKQRKAYQTPKEIFDIVNMQENAAQTGFSPQTLDYLTSKTDAGLASSLGTAGRLGADPNTLSTLVDSYSKDIFGIAGENELTKMKKYDGLLNALQLLSQSKDAEWASKDNLIKDQMAAQAAKLQAARENVQSGLNLIGGGISGIASSNLYSDGSAGKVANKGTAVSTSTGTNPGSNRATPSQILQQRNNP